MDSLTQIALGAAVGEATLGRKVGSRAPLWGALCGTLPDLDVLVPLGDPVSDFVYHRSYSHSLFVLAALTPLVVWLILRMHPRTREHRTGWAALVYLAFATHVLLDSFTVYGTQILWPLDRTPVGWSTIFIIDPLYTLPLLVGLTAALIGRRHGWGHRMNTAGLALSTLYLAWTLGAKLHVENVARESLARQGVAHDRLLTTPTPFNTLLWRILVMRDGDYYEAFYSVLDEDRSLQLERYQGGRGLLAGLQDHPPVRRLTWFTKGFYAAERRGGDIVVSDLRMGVEPDYAFRFKVGEVSNPHPVPAPAQRISARRDRERLDWLWRRIWSETPGAPAA
jgi:inner membrane protein